MSSVAFWGKNIYIFICFNIYLRPKVCDWHWKIGERKNFGRKRRYLLAVTRNMEKKSDSELENFVPHLRRVSNLSF